MKKLFIKICKLFGLEIIDQNRFSSPTFDGINTDILECSYHSSMATHEDLILYITPHVHDETLFIKSFTIACHIEISHRHIRILHILKPNGRIFRSQIFHLQSMLSSYL